MANASGTYGARSADAGDGWGPATSVRSAGAGASASATSDATAPGRVRARAGQPRSAPQRLPDVSPVTTGRGLAGWSALAVLVAAVVLGAIIDWLVGTHASAGLNILLIVGSGAAILLVRRAAMFTIVVAPPIVYSVVSGLVLFVRSSGLHDHRQLIDSASNWLVYGFPTVAAATALVLIVAGIRMLARR